MSRRCSHCGHNGHNSRTCLDRGFKLFGVRLTDLSLSPTSSSAMRKSVSMGNLSSYGASDAVSSSCPQEQPETGVSLDGYVSDDLVHSTSNSRERKKGVPWTEEEHRLFLLGLQKLGKGDWRGISRDFVKTRTPTQVASHAQKYFLRRSHLNKRRRRSSLFDITPDTEDSALEESALEGTDVCPLIHQLSLGQNMTFSGGGSMEPGGVTGPGIPIAGFSMPLPPLSLSCVPTMVSGIIAEGGEALGAAESGSCEMNRVVALPLPGVGESESDPGTTLSHINLPFPLLPLWPTPWFFERAVDSKIVKPTPIVGTAPVTIDESVKIPELSLATARPIMEPSPLSFKLLEERSRHSAFHTMSSLSGLASLIETRASLF
eukprot:c25210_g1_i10 orf=357-1481(+)